MKAGRGVMRRPGPRWSSGGERPAAQRGAVPLVLAGAVGAGFGAAAPFEVAVPDEPPGMNELPISTHGR